MTKAETLDKIKELDPSTGFTVDGKTGDELELELERLQAAAADAPAEPSGLSGAIASRADNADLEHSDSGTTTRADATDAGVPMLQGDPSEPVGPEDAFGEGEKRGDYSQRVTHGPHAETVPVEGGSQPIYKFVKDGQVVSEGTKGAVRQIVNYTPNAVLVDQSTNAADQGEVPGLKGGVTT